MAFGFLGQLFRLHELSWVIKLKSNTEEFCLQDIHFISYVLFFQGL